MKINLLKLFFTGLFCLSQPLWAQAVTVVKQQGNLVYLDTTPLSRNVQKGDSFKMILGKEKLSNPKTGASLGFIYQYSLPGQITEVQPRYAVGQLADENTYTPGQQAVIEASSATLATVAPLPDPVTNAASVLATSVTADTPVVKNYPVPISSTVIAVTQADITRNGREELITLDDHGLLTVFDKNATALTPLYTYFLGGDKTPITLSALDLQGNGRAQIFISFYDITSQQVSTQVLQLRRLRLQKLETLPYFVKELGCGPHKKLYAQKAFTQGVNPGDAQQLEYKEGHFSPTGPLLKTYNRWLSGVNQYNLERPDHSNFIYTEPEGAIKATLQNDAKAASKDLFAGAPNRVKYKQNFLTFYPSLQVYGPEGKSTVAALQNVVKKGASDSRFGPYQGSILHFLKLENGRLVSVQQVSLSGYAYDTACTTSSILIPEIVDNGVTRMTEIFY